MWWWRLPQNPTAYDDDWEDQPPQSAFHKWALGVALPAAIFAYGIWVLLTREAQVGGHMNPGQITMTLHGSNAVAYGVAVLSAALFLHCHYFWGNIYNQAWLAVLGKIISACGFIAAIGFLCVRVGVLGRT